MGPIGTLVRDGRCDEARTILRILYSQTGSKKGVARALGVSSMTVWRWEKILEIDLSRQEVKIAS